MANVRWEPKALPTKQVTTVTVALTWAQNDTVTITINTKAMVITIGTLTTTAQVATTIKQAWEGETLTDTSASVTPSDGGRGQGIIEHSELTATVSGSVVTLTANEAGRPITITVSESTAGDGTATGATATAATGPNHWDNTDNWSGGSLPVSTDDVFVDNSDVSILYGIDQNAVTLTSMTIGRNFTGTIGLPKTTPAGYTEYLDDYLQISATTLTIGRGAEGNGSGRIKIDTGSNQTAVSVRYSAASIEFGLNAIIWKGTHASNTFELLQGSASIAPYGGESATVATLSVASGILDMGDGCTLTTVTNQAGTIDVRANTTTLTNATGTTTVHGAATVATLNANGGRINYNSSGTITTLNLGGPGGATIDFSGDNSSRTVSTLNLNSGSTIIDPLRTVTWSSIVIGSDVEQFNAA